MPTARTSPSPGCGRWPRPPTQRPRSPTPTSTAASPRRTGTADAGELASPAMADWNDRAQGRAGARGGARRAFGRGRVPGRERRVLGLGGSRGHRQLARLRGVLCLHAGVGLRLGLRGRGRRPHDGARHRAWGAIQGRSTRRRSGSRRPTGPSRWWARASRRAAAARWCWTRSWRRRSPGSSGRCCRPTRFSAVARCSRAARATRWPSPRSRWSMTARHPDGPASAPFDGEGSATRRTPLIEGGRLAGYLYDARTRAQGRPRDHRQCRPRVLSLAAIGVGHQPAGRSRGGDPRGARAARPATACT